MKTYLVSGLIALVVVALGIGLLFRGSSGLEEIVPGVGGVTNADALEAESLAIGNECDNAENSCDGTTITKMLTGICNAFGPSAGMAATSTTIYMCSVSGAASGDKVFVSLPAGANVATTKAGGSQSFGTGGIGGGSVLSVGAAFATTTDVIGFEIINLGPASTTARQATTSIQYWILDS